MAESRLITADEAVDLIEAETGSAMTAHTFRSYTYRGQAPAPVKKIGRTQLYSRKQILEWAQNRPGSGARTDLVQAKPRQHPAPPAPAAPTDSPSATEEAPSAPAKTTRRRAKTSQLKPTAD